MEEWKTSGNGCWTGHNDASYLKCLHKSIAHERGTFPDSGVAQG